MCFLVSCTALPVRVLGDTRIWEDTISGQLTQTGQRDILYHKIFLNWRGRGQEGTGAAASAWCLTGYWLVGGKQLF